MGAGAGEIHPPEGSMIIAEGIYGCLLIRK
jgi:hypothetical protein